MSEFHALVPAAGFGARMGHEIPKQYLPLAGQPMIFHALTTLCACTEISTVFVVLSPEDTQFQKYDLSRFGDKLQPLVLRRCDTSGISRQWSVGCRVGAGRLGDGA